jgi:hypothetical protein
MSTKTITFDVTFKGGAGEITFSAVDGLDGKKTLDADQTKPTDEQTFDVDQSTGPQNVTVGGAAPDGGFINVDVKDGDTLLTSAKYDKGEFDGKSIGYNVSE